MGNSVSPKCLQKNPKDSSSVKLVFWDGTTRILKGKHIAGEIMFEFPDKMICHADSFFINHPIPSLSIDDELMPGQTYFILPIDCFPCDTLSASSLASFRSSPNGAPIDFGTCPFEYIKGGGGRILMKVSSEFITRLIIKGKETESRSERTSFLCTSPELKKQYDLLVGTRDQVWSPKLETIPEYKTRFSPCRYIGLEWKQKKKSNAFN